MQKLISHNLEETAKIAQDWLLEMETKYKQRHKALIVGLSGHLGAGKTAFVKAVARALGINESVTSPTFVIMKMYEINKNNEQNGYDNKDESAGNLIKWKKLIHIDFYRLEKKEEIVTLRLQELISDKNNLIMMEWPENVDFKVDEQITFQALEQEGLYEIVL